MIVTDGNKKVFRERMSNSQELIYLATVLRPSLGTHNSARRMQTAGILTDGGSPLIYCLFTCAS